MSFQEQLKQIRELSGLNENVKSLLERMTGKELVSYEGIDALVAALMTFYNGELKKKAPSSHTHDDRYSTKSEINEKFKNFCPIPAGGVLTMWNETNPTSLYLGTTWELISAGKYIKTGSTALQNGGTNSITLTKANLPNIKVKIDSFSITVPPHSHDIQRSEWNGDKWWNIPVQADERGNGGFTHTEPISNQTTGVVSPYTETLGNSDPISIQPEYITLKFWKRTS